MRQRTAFTLNFRPSALLAAFLFVLHFAAVGVALYCLSWQGVGGLLLTALVLSLVRSLRIVRGLHHPQLVALRIGDDGAFEMIDGAGTGWVAQVETGTLVWPWLVVLHLKGAAVPRWLPLPRNSLAADDHRRLRVWLRCRVGDASA